MLELEQGKSYRVRYKQQSGNYRWYEWELVAVFIGTGDGGKLLFSLRPLAGTQDFDEADVLGAAAESGRNYHITPRQAFDERGRFVMLPRKIGPHAADDGPESLKKLLRF